MPGAVNGLWRDAHRWHTERVDTEMAEPELETCGTLAAVERLVRSQPAVFLRYSTGPRDDLGHRSMDGESGLPLPGLSVNPLTPEDWWTRPLRHWLARQLVQYRHLADEHDRIAWALTGRVSGRGPRLRTPHRRPASACHRR